jgi:hypothetical protein
MDYSPQMLLNIGNKNLSKEIYNDVLNDLQDYILDDNSIQRALQYTNILNTATGKYSNSNVNSNASNNSSNNTEFIKKKNSLFIPKEKDTLFWCFYIMKNQGTNNYESLYSKNEVIASQLKIEYVERLRKDKKLVKTYKFDTLTNIECNLANEKILNIKSFLTLCVIENMNVLIITNKTYYELLMNDTEDIYVIRCLENKNKGQYEKKYGYELVTKDYSDTNIKPLLYRIDNIDKPIKAMSAYKSDDLVEICKRLGIDTIDTEKGKIKVKKELYEAIIQYF